MQSTTARLLPTIKAESSARVSDIKQALQNHIMLELPETLESRLTLLNTRLNNNRKIKICKGEVAIDDLTNTFESLEALDKNTLTSEEFLATEEYKLTIMKAIEHDLQRYVVKKKEIEEQTAVSKWRLALFAGILLLDLIPMAVGGFVGMTTLLDTIPEISTAATYIISLLVTAIETLLVYSVTAPLLKKALGIFQRDSADSLVELYNEKIQKTKSINSILTNELESADKISLSRYRAYAGISKKINNDISNTKIEPFKEPLIKKIARLGLSGLNLVLNIAGGYFMATALLTTVAAALVGTPIGWFIVGLVVLGGLAGRFVVRSDSMHDLLNPKAKKHHNIEKKLKYFENQNEKIDSVQAKKIARQQLTEAHKPPVITCLPSAASRKMPAEEPPSPADIAQAHNDNHQMMRRYSIG